MPIVPSSGDLVASPLHRYRLLKLLNKGACANAFSAADENGEKVFLKAYTSPTTLKPWYDVTDWFRVRGTLGVAVPASREFLRGSGSARCDCTGCTAYVLRRGTGKAVSVPA